MVNSPLLIILGTVCVFLYLLSNKKPAILILSFFLLTGCGDPKIDANSVESLQKSIEKVHRSLPEEKRDVFDYSLRILAFSQLDLTNIIADGFTGIGSIESKVKHVLHGKTGDEVIQEVERIQKRNREKERAEALIEIQELEDKKEYADWSRQSLEDFQVISSHFYKLKQKYGSPEPIIGLAVHNWTSHTISRAYFIGSIVSPDRAVPWFSDSFNYEIPGGLEPGEEAEWILAPKIYSEWGSVKAPPDAMLTVEVVKLDGADGQTLFSSQVFSDEDADRLNKLKRLHNVN